MHLRLACQSPLCQSHSVISAVRMSIRQDNNMAKKIAVVTGARKGLGFAIVKALLQSPKYNGIVYLTTRTEATGLAAVKEMNSLGLKPKYHQLDVADQKSVMSFTDFIKARHGGFDVLVNNAAILEWEEVYPTYEAAKRNIDINYRSLLTIEEYMYPLLRDGARVVNISSACGHLSNLKNQTWIHTLQSPDLTTEEINNFVEDYLKSVKNGTFNKNDFADDGKHAEHRVSKIALTALTKVQQRKYADRNICINAVHPGHIKTDMAKGGGKIDPDKAAALVLYLILDASPKLRGTFMWHDGKLIDWFDAQTDFACKDLW